MPTIGDPEPRAREQRTPFFPRLVLGRVVTRGRFFLFLAILLVVIWLCQPVRGQTPAPTPQKTETAPSPEDVELEKFRSVLAKQGIAAALDPTPIEVAGAAARFARAVVTLRDQYTAYQTAQQLAADRASRLYSHKEEFLQARLDGRLAPFAEDWLTLQTPEERERNKTSFQQLVEGVVLLKGPRFMKDILARIWLVKELCAHWEQVGLRDLFIYREDLLLEPHILNGHVLYLQFTQAVINHRINELEALHATTEKYLGLAKQAGLRGITEDPALAPLESLLQARGITWPLVRPRYFDESASEVLQLPQEEPSMETTLELSDGAIDACMKALAVARRRYGDLAALADGIAEQQAHVLAASANLRQEEGGKEAIEVWPTKFLPNADAGQTRLEELERRFTKRAITVADLKVADAELRALHAATRELASHAEVVARLAQQHGVPPLQQFYEGAFRRHAMRAHDLARAAELADEFAGDPAILDVAKKRAANPERWQREFEKRRAYFLQQHELEDPPATFVPDPEVDPSREAQLQAGWERDRIAAAERARSTGAVVGPALQNLAPLPLDVPQLPFENPPGWLHSGSPLEALKMVLRPLEARQTGTTSPADITALDWYSTGLQGKTAERFRRAREKAMQELAQPSAPQPFMPRFLSAIGELDAEEVGAYPHAIVHYRLKPVYEQLQQLTKRGNTARVDEQPIRDVLPWLMR